MKNLINSRNLGICLLLTMYIFSGINKILDFINISKDLKINLKINFL